MKEKTKKKDDESLRIDLYNKSKHEYYRAFCEPDDFWVFIGHSMKKNYDKFMDKIIY